MAQIDIKQIRGASQGSILFLGTSSVSEDWDKLKWVGGTFSINGGFQLKDGTEGPGLYLVSDSDGRTSWTSSIFTSAGNGLSLNNSEVILGGTLSQNTSINSDGFDLTIDNFDTLTLTGSVVDIQLDKETGSQFLLDVGDTGSVDIYGGQFLIVGTSSVDFVTSGEFTISASSSSINIEDGRGLVYTEDYSGTFVSQSLVTKEYVDNLVPPPGGSTGSILVKSSNLDWETEWTDEPIVDKLKFNLIAGESVLDGELAWNADTGTLALGIDGGNTLDLGEQTFYRVLNQTGTLIPKGTLVMAVGTVGGSGKILVAPWNGNQPSVTIMGITYEDIPTENEPVETGFGYVVHFGKIRGLQTNGVNYGESWSNGDIIYADPTGGLTKNKPDAPAPKVTIAIVINAAQHNGTLFVRPTLGSSISDDELVYLDGGVDGLQNGQVLAWNESTNRFENTFLVGPTGATGDSGPIGPTGATGDAGPIGPTGTGFETIFNTGANRVLTASGSNSAIAQENLLFDGGQLTVTGTVSTTGIRVTNSPNIGWVLTSDSSGNGSWQPTGTVNGSGIINYVARWIQSSTISYGTIWDNGTNVGIGITDSSFLFSIRGTSSLVNIIGSQSSGQNLLVVDGVNGRLMEVNDITDYYLLVNDNAGNDVMKISPDIGNSGSSIYIGGDTQYNPRSLYTTREFVNITSTQSIYRFATSSWTGAYIDFLVGNGTNIRSGIMTAVFGGSNFTYSLIETSLGSTGDYKIGFTMSATYSELIAWSTGGSFDFKGIIRSL